MTHQRLGNMRRSDIRAVQEHRLFLVLRRQPKLRNISSITSMSSSCGTLRSFTDPSASRLAAKIGKAAFLAPWMRMVPESGFPPSITSLSKGFTSSLSLTHQENLRHQINSEAVCDGALYPLDEL
ncbi:hypothetical protein [Cohnella faecalis]